VPNELATAQFGQRVDVPVYAKQDSGGQRLAQVTLTATSESDPAKRSTATCYVVGR
jgi:hypothetical protein